MWCGGGCFLDSCAQHNCEAGDDSSAVVMYITKSRRQHTSSNLQRTMLSVYHMPSHHCLYS